jgi:hypothetical protein
MISRPDGLRCFFLFGKIRMAKATGMMSEYAPKTPMAQRKLETIRASDPAIPLFLMQIRATAAMQIRDVTAENGKDKYRAQRIAESVALCEVFDPIPSMM